MYIEHIHCILQRRCDITCEPRQRFSRSAESATRRKDPEPSSESSCCCTYQRYLDEFRDIGKVLEPIYVTSDTGWLQKPVVWTTADQLSFLRTGRLCSTIRES